MKRGMRPAELIRRTAQALSALYSEGGQDGLTLPQFSILSVLHEAGPQSCGQLTALTRIDRATTFNIVDRLISEGLVLPHGNAPRVDGKPGRTALTFKLSAHGRAALAAAEVDVWKAEKAMVNSLPAAKRAAFLDALEVVAFAGPRP